MQGRVGIGEGVGAGPWEWCAAGSARWGWVRAEGGLLPPRRCALQTLRPLLSVGADCGVRGHAIVAHRVRRGGSLTRESRVARRTPCVFGFNTGAPATRVVSRSGRRGAGAPLSFVELTVLRPCETPSLGKLRGARLWRDGGRRDRGKRDR